MILASTPPDKVCVTLNTLVNQVVHRRTIGVVRVRCFTDLISLLTPDNNTEIELNYW